VKGEWRKSGFLRPRAGRTKKNARDEGERKEKSAGGLDLANEAIGKETK